MSNKVRFFALILALNIFFLCGCEGGNSSSKAVFSSEPDKVTSVASEDNAETSKEATPSSKKPTSTSTSSKKPTSTSTGSKKPTSTSTSSKKPSKNTADNKKVNIYGNSQGNLNGGAWAAIQGDWIYYSTYDAFYKMKTDGSENQKIFDDSVGKINVVGEWLYFSRDGKDISRMKTDGSEYKKILKNVNFFTVVNHKVYYTDRDTGYLYRIDENGANKVLLIEQACSYEVVVTTDAIYWGGSEGALFIADINGKNIKCIESFYPQGLIVDGELIYDSGNLKISDAKTGKEIKQYFRENGGAMDINISGDWIYFIYWEGEDCRRIHKIKKDGSKLQKLSDINAMDLMVVGDWIFYTKTELEKYDGGTSGYSSDRYRMRIDGSDNQMISKWDWKYWEF